MIYDYLLSQISNENKKIIDSYISKLSSSNFLDLKDNEVDKAIKNIVSEYKKSLNLNENIYLEKDRYNFTISNNDLFEISFFPHRNAIDISIQDNILFKNSTDTYILKTSFSFDCIHNNYESEISIYNSKNIDAQFNIIYSFDEDNNIRIEDSINILDISINSESNKPPYESQRYILGNINVMQIFFEHYFNTKDIFNILHLVEDTNYENDEILYLMLQQVENLTKKIKNPLRKHNEKNI